MSPPPCSATMDGDASPPRRVSEEGSALNPSKSLIRHWSPVWGPMLVAAVTFGIARSAYSTPPSISDAYTFVRTAQGILQRGVLAFNSETPNAFVGPVYPLVLAGLFLAAGGGSDAQLVSGYPLVMAVQFCLCLGIVAMIALAGRHLGGRRLAWLAGILAALYLPFVWAASVALTELLGASLAAALVCQALAISKAVEPRGWPLWALFGATSALLALTRSAFAIWPPLVLLWLFARSWRTVASRRGLLTFALAFLLVMGPWWIRNAATLHSFIPLVRTQAFDAAAAGGDLTAEEKAIQARAIERGGDPHYSIAFRRILTRLGTDPVGLLAERTSRAGRTVWAPWSAVADVAWEEVNYASKHATRRIDYAERPWLPKDWMVPQLGFTRFYHRFLMVFALVSLFFVRRVRGLALVASLPVYAVGVHFVTYFTVRYFFPAMPAVILMAAAGLYGSLISLLRRAASSSRDADRMDASSISTQPSGLPGI